MSGSQFVQRGQALVERQQFQEAVKVCRLGLLASPTEVEGRLVLGEALIALLRFDEALAEMRVALELEPANERACVLKGEALLRKGDALQAREVLERAHELGAGPRASALLDEIHEVLGASGKRRRSLSFAPSSEEEQFTKHYPTAMGGIAPFDAGADPAESVDPEDETRERDARDASPSPFAPGESSATIELDPEDDSEELPTASLGPAAARLREELDPAAIGAAPIEPGGHTGPIELDTDDVELVDGEPSGASVFDALLRDGEDPTAHYRPAQPRAEDSGSLIVEPPTAVGAPPSGVTASAAAIDELFPEDPSGVSRIELERLSAASGEVETRPARRPKTPAVITDLASPSPAPAPAPPPFAPPAPRPPSPPATTAKGHLGPALAPGASRSRTSDMELIKQGLGLEGVVPGGRRRAGRRSGVTAYLLVAVVVIGGAVYAGLRVREARLDRDVRRAVRAAEKLAQEDTLHGYRRAEEAYRLILEVRDTEPLRAAHARILAAAAAEFGVELEAAQRRVAALEGVNVSDAHAARAYLAIARGETAAARTYVDALEQTGEAPGRASYLAGRVALLAGRPGDAVDSFGNALAGRPSPAPFVWLARAHANQGRRAEALAAIDAAISLVSGYPPALIERARVQIETGALPDPADLEHVLEGLIDEAGKPLAEQRAGVAPRHLAWAELLIAKALVARGSRPEARKALERALAARPEEDPGFSEGVVGAYLALGELERARDEAQAATERWKTRAETQIRLAEVELRTGNAADALAVLEGVSSIESRPDALAVRGLARMQLGELDAAAADLDAALAVRPDLREAKIARAEVELERGDARGAVALLKPLYEASSTVDIGIVYASALRRSGERERARTVLNAVLEESQAAEAYLELARLDRDEGQFREARRAYARAIEADPESAEPRLEAAMLARDVGDVQGAREALDQLALDAPGSGRVLVAAAQLRTLSGDQAGAAELLDKAAAEPSAPRWMVERERGRLYLRSRRPKEAVAALEQAASLQPDDGETRLLLIDAYHRVDDAEGASAALSEILKRFGNGPVAGLALGQVHLLNDRPRDAMKSFSDARDTLERSTASPRELARAHFWVGRTHYYEGDLVKAKQSLGLALELAPRFADAWFFLGLVQAEDGDASKAISAYSNAVEADPYGLPDAWFYLGETAANARRRKTARSALQVYLERFPDGVFVDRARTLLEAKPDKPKKRKKPQRSKKRRRRGRR